MKILGGKLSPMGEFTLQYLLWSPLLFGLFYFENFSPFILINQLQTDLTIYLMHQWISFYTLHVTMIGADLFFDHGLHLTVVNECNGMAAFLLFFAAVLSYPTFGHGKVVYLIIGYFILLFLNMVRLTGITYYVIDHPEAFTLLHEVIGRYVIAGIPLILFYIFSSRCPLKE
jgi:exosortase/archaeosortase family protein